MWGLMSKSATTMSWSEMPGMLDEDFTREALYVNMISSILEPRLG